MHALSTFVQLLPLLAGVALGGASLAPIPRDKTTPSQQRLAIRGPDAMSVGWNTFEQLSKPCVSYGTSKDSLDRTACSLGRDSKTYPTSRTWFNSVTLTGLKPATRYYYKVHSSNSTVDFFQSPRAAGDKTPFSLNTVVDLGVYGEDGFTIQGNTSRRSEIPEVQPALNHTTIGALAKTIDDYELWIHPGDFAYADDWYIKGKNLFDGKEAFIAILENFYQQTAPVTGRIPWMASPGNHEADCSEATPALCPTGQKNFTDFMTRFGETMPTAFPSASSNETARALANKAAALAKPPFWYSFDYGLLHVVMIDTETDFKDSPDGPGTSLNSGPFGYEGQQLEFIEADLASVDRSVTPFIMTAGHRPWYSTGDSENVCSSCQAAFEPLFYKYGVDVSVFGHVHNSQLFRPVYEGMTDPAGYENPKAPLYVVAGGSGNIEGLSKVGQRQSYNDFAYGDDYSYATFTFKSETQMAVDFKRSSTGETLYSATLNKKHDVDFVRQ